jgi:molecular chaperone GrpE
MAEEIRPPEAKGQEDADECEGTVKVERDSMESFSKPKLGAQKKVKKKKVVISQEEYDELTAKAKLHEGCQDNILRLHAEFENFKKRMTKEKAEFMRYANEELLTELLMVIDHFESGIDTARKGENFNSLFRGMEMILKELYDLLNNKGLSLIETVGKKFDPHCHEAIMQVETDEYPEGFVVEEIRKGYRFNDRVIRPAVVKISKSKQELKEEQKDLETNHQESKGENKN